MLNAQLTEEKLELISENWEEINKGVNSVVFNPRYRGKFARRFGNDLITARDSVLSFAAECAREWEEERDDKTFSQFCIIRSIKRTLGAGDCYNTLDSDGGQTYHTKSLIRKAWTTRDNVIKEHGFCTQQMWLDALLELRLYNTVEKHFELMRLADTTNVGWTTGRGSEDDQTRDEVYSRPNAQGDAPDVKPTWNDTKRRLLENMSKHFAKNNKATKAYRKIVTDYLIPTAEGSEAKTFDQIAKEIGCKFCYISILIRDDKMMAYLKDSGFEVDGYVKQRQTRLQAKKKKAAA